MTSQPTSAYHWVMTVQTADGQFNTRSAIVDVPATVSRQQVFHFVLEQFKETYDGPLTVLFFDLQPNQL
ncbi:hypothetical protein [Streptomyces sp. NPDC006971]|uniref:hypothetical protein n=1 Tax=Streptomyces sp. NPDC006971 TaxID=3154784 RepID=UPI0033D274EE